MKRIFPPAFYNPLTLVGAAVAALSFGLTLFLLLLETVAEHPKPYMGIIAFVVLPVFLVIGIAAAAYGVLRTHRRLRAGIAREMQLPRIDLNNPHHRTAFAIISAGAILFLLFSAFGSFKAYEYTDSDAFCGETCHKVMSPEYTAYQYSPHARVGCVKCHIGSGADWFVRSKLSGTYQVYATIFNKYPRPILTPIQNLRPAQETCEQCHWPKHFFSEKEQSSSYYLSDEKNTRLTLTLLIKIGGGNIEAGPTSGIHWHMNIANEVVYFPADSTRQVIPWVRVTSPDGKRTVYRSTENAPPEEAIQKAKLRRMDCIDCHNRPTHIYHPPARSVNHVMSLGWVDPQLPNVKSVAVKVLETPYATTRGGLDSIKLAIDEYYRITYPEVARTMQPAIQRAIEEVQNIYGRNYFPEMQVSWKRFPDNIGHMYYPGCFRCHDGKHVSEDGKVLSRECNTCHVILAQQMGTDSLHLSLSGVQYQHPVDIGDAWKETNCSDCHSGN
jgi:nitrate/TMAO reductase-like tetraheme cytochrome c subunit